LIRKGAELGNKGAVVAKEYAESFGKGKDPVPMGYRFEYLFDQAAAQI
jgi:hypothetical protein